MRLLDPACSFVERLFHRSRIERRSARHSQVLQCPLRFKPGQLCPSLAFIVLSYVEAGGY
jgi:hypothetical protein